jgi:HlyD family secretion protein
MVIDMNKSLIVVPLILAAGAGGGFYWWNRGQAAPAELVLFGNVDLRQVALPFNNNERIADVLVQEGDHIRRGQVLARSDVSRLKPQVDQAEAQVAAQRAAVDRLRNGSRPEEIEQARANVASAKADALNLRRQFERKTMLSTTQAAAQQDVEIAKAAADVAEAKVKVSEKALELVILGPRAEDIAQAEAQLRGDEAQLVLLRQQLADAELTAPLDAVVRSRLMEPGEMASPQKPVLMLAVSNPKWVRAYVAEPDLGKVHPGMASLIATDAFADRRFEGWVGFISSVAEFTPKSVQTQELRTSLVYEVRVFVTDPKDELRLGAPATVYLAPDATKSPPAGTAPVAER